MTAPETRILRAVTILANANGLTGQQREARVFAQFPEITEDEMTAAWMIVRDRTEDILRMILAGAGEPASPDTEKETPSS